MQAFELISPAPFSYKEKEEKISPLFSREGSGVSSRGAHKLHTNFPKSGSYFICFPYDFNRFLHFYLK
jgi:hypothetical protein